METARRAQFPTTQWTLVMAAGSTDAGARAALASLCECYWFPLYAYARRRGYPPDEAQDLTQGFLSQLIERRWLDRADPVRGRFRSFLLVSMKRYLADQLDRVHAAKRGGGVVAVPISLEDGEQRYSCEPASWATPEVLYERQWAITLLNRVLEQIGGQYESSGRGHQFQQLKPFLAGDEDYSQVAANLKMTEGALRVAVHRLRRQYRDLIRAEIAQTVESDEDVADEIRHLLHVVSGT